MNRLFFLINNCTLFYFSGTGFILLLFLLFPVNLLYSQVLLEKDNSCILESGIQVKKQVACTNENDELRGKNVLWDFSNWKLINQNYTSKYFDTGSNSVSKYEHRTFYNYELKSDTLFLCKYRNSTTDISYLIPEISLVYPLEYEDSIFSYFYGVGDYSNHINVRVYGKKNICADAFGTLILPSGDTISNIIRVHSEKMMQYQFESGILSELDSILVPPIDTIANCLYRSNDLIKMDVFEWYMGGYCKPIFETVKNTLYKSGKPYKYFCTSFYCPIEELNINVDNAGIRLRKESESFSKFNMKSEETSQFNSFLDEGGQNILLEYNSVEGATVDVMLFDIQGRLLFHDKSLDQNSGKYNLCIDISRYAQTEFIVRLSINEKIYSKKVFIK